ncbi:MAG: Ig-like domain-containing protein [Desulfobacteraceae bacterium]|nr:Ig-like domain-containing protein [Desulfobacteraceae bacterium]
MRRKSRKFKNLAPVMMFALIVSMFFAANVWAATVVSTSPADGAADVPVSAVITVTFSEAMDASTINSTTFFVRTGTGYNVQTVAGTISLNGATATFTPASLDYGKKYTATVTGNAKDLNGNPLQTDYIWSFTTGQGSGTLEITSTSPTSGETGVFVGTSVTVTFSKEMNSSTLNSNTFFVYTGGTGYNLNTVPGTINCSGKTATFTPSSPFDYKKAYKAKVTTGVKDTDGNALAADYEWSFVTADQDTPTSPKVSSVRPADMEDDVDVGAVVKVFFSKTMNPATVNSNTFFLFTATGDPVEGTVIYSNTEATLDPVGNLDYETEYTATVTTGAKDTEGNPLEADYTWSFTTAPEGVTYPTVKNVIERREEIIVDFNQQMNPSTINEHTIIVKAVIPGVGYGIVAGVVEYEGTTAIFIPYSDLLDGISYSLTVTTGAKDTAGRSLKTDYEKPFVTGGSVKKTGIFLAGPVEGLYYASGSSSGHTDSSGTFMYEVGKPVVFIKSGT